MLNFVWKQRRHIVLASLLLTAIASSTALATKEVKWEKSIERGLAEAKKTGKPVIMDFYTVW